MKTVKTPTMLASRAWAVCTEVFPTSIKFGQERRRNQSHSYRDRSLADDEVLRMRPDGGWLVAKNGAKSPFFAGKRLQIKQSAHWAWVLAKVR